MVIDFSDLKKIVKEEIVEPFDHATVFNKNTPHLELANELKDRGHKVILADYQPTSENMVIDFASKIKARLPEEIQLERIILNRILIQIIVRTHHNGGYSLGSTNWTY